MCYLLQAIKSSSGGSTGPVSIALTARASPMTILYSDARSVNFSCDCVSEGAIPVAIFNDKPSQNISSMSLTLITSATNLNKIGPVSLDTRYSLSYSQSSY